MVELSVIVPIKNESTGPKVIKELYAKLGNGTEIIVVDKSDPDMREPLYATGAKIMVQKSSGYTAALMDGFRAAHGDIISTIDPDGTYSVDDFKRIVETLKSSDADRNACLFGLNAAKGRTHFWWTLLHLRFPVTIFLCFYLTQIS